MKNNQLFSRRLLWTLAALAIFSTNLPGQATDSIVVGTVTDPTGLSVPGATVTATNKDTNVVYTTVTTSTGAYRINNVPVGRYDVSATAKGFATATTAGVQLELNRTATVNIILPVGSVATVVEVTEAVAAIDTASAQLSTTYDTRIALDVPVASQGAGIYNLSLLGAGVATSGGVGQGTGPSIAGQRPENNSFNIDGVGNDDHYQTGPQANLPNDAIAQFTLVQNQFSAEFGGASGGVFNAIVKSGTNQLHGSIYEYMQNRDLNAVDQSRVQQQLYSNPRYDNNRLGATIGGPILKNKLFYFGLFEYNPVGQAAQPGQTVYAPTSAGLSVLNGMSNLSKTNLGVFEQYVPVAPAATNDVKLLVNNALIPNGPLSFASPAYTNTYNFVVSIDYNLSEKDQIRGRYLYNNKAGLDTAAALPVFFASSPNVNNQVSISEFHNFSPTMENELRLSYSRNNQNIAADIGTFPGLAVFPNIAVDDLQLQMGPDPNTPTGSIENKAQLQENITKTWGKHTFKAGLNFTDIILTGFFIQRARGDYDYASLEEYLLDKQPSGGDLSGVSGERSVGSASGTPFGFLQWAGYFSDDWRILPNLTLNLGLRYEYVTMPVGSRYQANNAGASVPDVIDFNRPYFSHNDWGPRIGFAYSPGRNGIWSIRGGFARSFDNTYINLNQNASPPYFQTTVDVDANNPVNNFLANGGLQSSLAGSNPTPAELRSATASYTFGGPRPNALTATLGVQRLLGKDYTIEARYVYTKGIHLWNQTRLNRITQVTDAQSIPTYLQMPSASALANLTTTLGYLQSLPTNTMAQYGFPNNIVGYHPWGNSRYSGLAIQMNKRYSHNFMYIAAFTWSHSQDDSTATNFSTILSPRRAQDFQNLRAEWANSALDHRYRLTLTPIYDWMPFQGKNYFMKNVVGNWNISFTYTYQSPEYATVQSGVDSNLNGDGLDRSIINPTGAATAGSGVVGYTAAGVPVAAGSSCSSGACKNIVAYAAKDPNARYIMAGLGAHPNSGRNTLPLDATNNWDASLLKRVRITERFNLQLGVQAFNLFNHSQFVGGYLSDVTPYGTAAISRNFLVPSNSTFAGYQGYFPSNSRTLQLAAKFRF
jgi:hypothetical protein